MFLQRSSEQTLADWLNGWVRRGAGADPFGFPVVKQDGTGIGGSFAGRSLVFPN